VYCIRVFLSTLLAIGAPERNTEGYRGQVGAGGITVHSHIMA